MRSANGWWKDWAIWLVLVPVLLTLAIPAPAPPAPGGALTWNQVVPLVSYLAVSFAAFWLSRRVGAAAPKGEAGFSWRIGAAGYGVLFCGDLLFTVGYLWDAPLMQSAAAMLFAAVFPIFIWALIRALRRLTGSVGVRLALDLASVAATCGMLVWDLSQEAARLGTLDLRVVAMAAGFPVGNLAMIVVSGLALFEVQADRCNRPMVLLGVSNFLFLLANLGFSQEIVRNGGLAGLVAAGTTFGLASFGARLLVALAAWDQYRMMAAGQRRPIPRGLALWVANVVPYSGLLAAVYMLSVGQQASGNPRPLLLCVGGLMLLVIIRQQVVLRENISLASESLQLAHSLHRSEARFRSVVQNSSDIICITDRLGRVTYVSPAVTEILGYGEAELTGMPVREFVHLDDLQHSEQAFRKMLERTSDRSRLSVRLLHRNSGFRHMAVAVNNLLHDPAVEGIVFNLRDVTDRVMLEEQLKHQAFHDPLTGLANRALLRDRIGQALALASRRGEELAVFLLDLDGFKVVNDTRGHISGDRLLSEVAARLVGEFGPGDTVSRLGGDEFAVLVEGAGAAEAGRIADRIMAALLAPFSTDGREVVLGVSMGIALGAGEGQTTDDLLRNADLAMYQAKAAGKGCYRFFEPGMYSAMASRLDLEADLRRALATGEFELHYQPTVSMETGAIRGVEALLRWRRGSGGMVSPAQFIPLAEETGLIVPLGRWVLEEACRQARQWQQQQATRLPLTVSVNLSVRQLHDPNLVSDVKQVLASTGLSPASLVLEITESVFLESTDKIMATMQQLRQLGVRLAVDDFGTGFSSLAYLKQFPLDVLKIDQSFIRTLGVAGRDYDLVRGILDLARVLRMETVAEGVERAEQLETLKRLGCDLAQGYFLARPAGAEAVGQLLAGQAAPLRL